MMDTLITLCLLGALAMCMLIITDYMHRFAGMTYKCIAAIMFPIWLIVGAMFYLTLTY